MKKGVKIFIMGAVIAIAIVVIVILVRKGKAKRAAALVQTPASGGTSGAGTSGGTTINVGGNTGGSPTAPAPRQPSKTFLDLPDGTFPIKKGQKSKLVYMLQRYLNVRYNAGLKEDGDYGNATETAAKTNLKATVFDAAQFKSAYAGIPASAYKDFEDLATWLKTLKIVTWN